MPLRPVTSDPNLTIAVSGALLVVNNRGSSSQQALDHLENAQVQLENTYGHIMLLVGITSKLDRGDEELRKKSAEITARHEKTTLATAFVVLTKGLAGVMVRTFLSGYFLLAKTPMPQRVFNEVGPALDWLRSLDKAPDSLNDAELERQIRDFLT